jgi:phosphatidylserine decarboxylase
MIYMDKFPLAASGWPYVGVACALLLMAWALGLCLLALLLLAALLFIIWFFRDPGRQNRGVPPLALLAPADGRVVAMEEVEHRELGKALLLSIFMNVFNVHVNRLPLDGTVEEIRHIPGGYRPADQPLARLGNERLNLVLRLDDGRRLIVSQVAGLVARNIECWLNAPCPGQRGMRYGMIRFGSRVDLYLPVDTRIAVQRGQTVTAGETVIGIMADA